MLEFPEVLYFLSTGIASQLVSCGQDLAGRSVLACRIAHIGQTFRQDIASTAATPPPQSQTTSIVQNTVQGRVRAKMAKFGKNRVFHHFGSIGFCEVGHAEVVCIIVAVPACVRFSFECAHAYASRHACHCAKVFLSLCAEVS